MGFNADEATSALRENRNRVPAAVAWLLEHSDKHTGGSSAVDTMPAETPTQSAARRPEDRSESPAAPPLRSIGGMDATRSTAATAAVLFLLGASAVPKVSIGLMLISAGCAAMIKWRGVQGRLTICRAS
eukprot:SAG11_NODE_131_length_15487_cov_5.744996_14_plen_129_part_00